jgi:hypothetical protein
MQFGQHPHPVPVQWLQPHPVLVLSRITASFMSCLLCAGLMENDIVTWNTSWALLPAE